MECVLAADGSYTEAARNCKSYGISKHYIRDLMYSEKHRAWQLELQRRLLSGMAKPEDVDENFVIQGLIELTARNVQDSVRLGAYKAIGDYLGMWAPREEILRVDDLKRLEELGISKHDILAEIEEILNESREG